jgi:hypothetical protein
MRSHSEPLQRALIDGLTAAGLDVVDIGLPTTPMNYFAIGHTGAAGGIQVTASHNPAQYNGFKFSRREARPVSGDHGIALMEQKVAAGDLPEAERRGTVEADVFEAYRGTSSRHLRSARRARRRLKVVADAANGMGTLYRPIFEAMPASSSCRSTSSSTAPSPTTRPTRSRRRTCATSEAVREHGCDLGVAFDGDADRAAFVDERGRAMGSDLITGADRRRAARATRAGGGLRPALLEGGPRVHREKGGEPVRERVGHSFMKATLRKQERRLRRRARRPLLLPRQLLRRLLDARRHRDPQPAARDRQAPVRAGRRRSRATPRARRSTSRSRTSRARSTSSPALRRRRDRLPRRHHGPVPHLVVQRPAVEHRAVSAAGARGRHGRGSCSGCWGRRSWGAAGSLRGGACSLQGRRPSLRGERRSLQGVRRPPGGARRSLRGAGRSPEGGLRAPGVKRRRPAGAGRRSCSGRRGVSCAGRRGGPSAGGSRAASSAWRSRRRRR